MWTNKDREVALVTRHDHIPLHRLWTYASIQHDLEPEAREHVIRCRECFEALKVCFKSDSFAAVLKNLGRDDDGYRTEAS